MHLLYVVTLVFISRTIFVASNFRILQLKLVIYVSTSTEAKFSCDIIKHDPTQFTICGVYVHTAE